MDRTALSQPEPFSQRVRRGFNRRAESYDRHARLQRAIAWRLARRLLTLPLPVGPGADLGAGTGLVGQSLVRQGWPHHLLQLDASPELLARNPLSGSHGSQVWDLNRGLPPDLAGAALLTSSFALQWLEEPLMRLEQWCGALAPAGWLGLAVPTAGSFPEWREAASRAQVPCTLLPLPAAEALETRAQTLLELKCSERMRFSLPCADGRTFLGQLKAIGAGSTTAAPLAPGQLRRLLQHWPSSGVATWEVMLLVGQKRP
ncbi:MULTISPECIES: hypothetical protein [Aphanothece]|uniref:hypothetical protein n=1 Tax=Aphanothece TaxID=1121 RepID=UPI00398543DE